MITQLKDQAHPSGTSPEDEGLSRWLSTSHNAPVPENDGDENYDNPSTPEEASSVPVSEDSLLLDIGSQVDFDVDFDIDLNGTFEPDPDAGYDPDLYSDSDSNSESDSNLNPKLNPSLNLKPSSNPKPNLRTKHDKNTWKDYRTSDHTLRNGTMQYDWEEHTASDVDDDDEEPEKEHSDIPQITGREFNVDRVLAGMEKINMDNDAEIKRRIEAALQPQEIEKLTITKEDEKELLSSLPENKESRAEVDGSPAIKKAVEEYRNRLGALIERQAMFLLSIGNRGSCIESMRGWLLFGIANATKERRERIVRILTHPAIQPHYVQYPLGRSEWTPGMFDDLRHEKKVVNLDKPDAVGDVVTAYIGVAHCPEGED
ncbi:hypothetical protein FALBO_8572 [Fusarium albosuccineum]|uniref:Uncharacterized protein n=1 Tax=Fusarium albosuccineum TaxID=1237068 RepID=A0A8H4P6T9_9HYPO|nr:hypothetical protein FALBO_8572 [Fusarium albosuccineum]